jgi:sortase A
MQRMTRHRLVRQLSSCLIIAGGIVLAYPLWSAGYAEVQQARLGETYRQSEQAFLRALRRQSPSPAVDDPYTRIASLANRFARRLRSGQPIGRLRNKRIGLNSVVLQGRARGAATDPDQTLLRSGPVHYANTPLPGQGQPFAIAGHRTTYGAPFRNLDRLRPGDQLVLVTPYATFTYRVAKKTVTRPTDTSVLHDRGYDLVLTTCHPPYSAKQRLVVWARLSDYAFR